MAEKKIRYPKKLKLIRVPRHTYATFQDARTRETLREKIREENQKNTARMEIERLQGELDKLAPGVRAAAMRRIAALSK